MYRNIKNKLIEWEKNSVKEPLLVMGARQIGKTYIIQEFCQETYEDYLYLNFENEPELNSIFEGSLKPEDILEQISALVGKRIDEHTAIFFDEVQRCEKMITSLKYFCEAEANYRILAAGSLLGVKLNRFEGSFPVGKVTIINMYPMSFDEFLNGIGEDNLVQLIKKAYAAKAPLAEAVHKKAMSLYRDYLIVGGMPAAVNEYIRIGRSIVEFERDIQRNILLAYQADMGKYTTGAAESVKIVECFESIPRQLSRENPKFKYSEVKAGANKRDFYSSIDWLQASGIVIKVDKLELPSMPLNAYRDNSNFRVYLSDVGLLSALAGVSYRNVQSGDDNIFKGILTENYVMQSLISHGEKVYYYYPDATMEIDAVIEIDGLVTPIEVKAGRHKRSTSLKNFNDKFKPKLMIRISENNFGKIDNLFSVPLYAAFCIPMLGGFLESKS